MGRGISQLGPVMCARSELRQPTLLESAAGLSLETGQRLWLSSSLLLTKLAMSFIPQVQNYC